jgi:peptidoglycan/LPS O-acetylase OafA/YrhL
MSQISEDKKYYPFLDGFRAIAILWVLLHHVNAGFGLRPYLVENYFPFYRFALLGYLGVDIFFVISGFLITGLLLDDLNSSIRIKRFYQRRAFKIVPQYLVAVVFGLCIAWVYFKDQLSFSSAFPYFALYQNYTLMVEPLRHLWSIAIEEHFYLIYPLLLWGICRCVPSAQKRKGVLLTLLFCLIVFGNVLRFVFFKNCEPPAEGEIIFFQFSHLRFDALAFGCLLKVIEPYVLSRFNKKELFLIGGLLCVVGVRIFVYFLDDFQTLGWGYYTLAYVASGCLIGAALLNFVPLRWLMEWPFLRWIGKNSYGIYLWHYPLIFIFKNIKFSGSWMVFNIMAYVAVSILAGFITTKTLERFFLTMRNKVAP